jgi:hypothetical protein
MPSNFIFKKPIIFHQGTGVTIDPNSTELLGRVSPSQTTTFSIGQAVASSSNVVFGDVTVKKVIIDSGSLILSGSDHMSGSANHGYSSTAIISGSFTLGGSFNVSESLMTNRNMTCEGRLTAKNIHAQVSQSFTLFDSGSTIFGDSEDDTHQFSGSIVSSGSIDWNGNYTVREFSNDTTLADSRAITLPTENAAKGYIDDQTDDQFAYLRKSFVYTGSFVSVSTASFSAYTASAPSDMTATSEDDFIFFLNGQMMEHDALTIEQSGSVLLLKVDNDSIGYDMEIRDEIVGFGKFAGTFNYLTFDGSNDEVTTNFSGSNATPLLKTYSFWYKSTETDRNYSVFGYGNQKRGAFTPNFSSGRPLIWNGNNWYVYWDDTSAQDDGEWHHWMLYNDVNAITGSKLYVDGVEQNVNAFVTAGGVGNLNNQQQPLTIGSYQNNSTNAGRHFEGSIREFAVFSGDRTSKAALYYNGGTPYDVTTESGLQAYWKMNEGSGTTVADSSGEGNNGTIDGATWAEE